MHVFENAIVAGISMPSVADAPLLSSGQAATDVFQDGRPRMFLVAIANHLTSNGRRKHTAHQ